MNEDHFWGALLGVLIVGTVVIIHIWLHGMTKSYVCCHSATSNTPDAVVDLPRGLTFSSCTYDVTPTGAVVKCNFLPRGEVSK